MFQGNRWLQKEKSCPERKAGGVAGNPHERMALLSILPLQNRRK